MDEEYCDNCGKETGTTPRKAVNNYVAHYCDECGADKRDCGSAPI